MRAANLRALETLVTGPQDGEALLPEGSIAARARYLPPSSTPRAWCRLAKPTQGGSNHYKEQ